MNKIRTLVYGSCVARDVIRVVPAPFELSGYIARQSWISAFTSRVEMPDAVRSASKFQARAVRGDFESTARSTLRRFAKDTNLLLIDIASDRHGVAEYKGGYVSLTPDHRRAFAGVVAGGRRVPFGQTEHRRLFASTVRSGVSFLDRVGLLENAIVLQAPFTDRTLTGAPMPGAFKSAEEINTAYAPYYDILRREGLHILALPDDLAVADLSHVWGPGQDHYADSAYVWWAEELTRKIGA